MDSEDQTLVTVNDNDTVTVIIRRTVPRPLAKPVGDRRLETDTLDIIRRQAARYLDRLS